MFQIIMLNQKSVLPFILTNFFIIILKLVAVRLYYTLLRLIKIV